MKQLVLIAATALLFVACSKENSFESSTAVPAGNTTSFITAKVNGSLTTFDVNDVAKLTDFGSGNSSLSITGLASADPSNTKAINLSINFFNTAPAVGTYTQDYSGSNYITAGVYNADSTTVVYTAGISTSTAVPLNITITKLDSTEIEGTFTGAFYKTDISNGSPSSEYVTLSDGTFKLPIQ